MKKPTAHHYRRVTFCLVPLLAGTVAWLPLAPNARSATYIWNGGGANNDFATAANWLGDAAPPSDLLNTDLLFGRVDNYPYPYLQSAYNAHSLVFSSDATGYSFSGQTLTLGAGGLTQNTAAGQSFGNPVVLGADQTWTLAAGAGALSFGSGLNTTDNGGTGHTLTFNVAAPASGGGDVLNGAITGAGALVKTGAGTLTLTGANTYQGTTTVSAGTLAITGSTNSGYSALTVDGTSAAAATLSLCSTSNVAGGAVYVGYNGSGTVNQSGNLNTNTIDFTLGYNKGSSGTYTLSGGNLATGAVTVGFSGTGTFTQTGGTFTISGLNSNQTNLLVGGGTGSSGTYTLSGGSVSTVNMDVGSSGAGTLTQTGGSITATNQFTVGDVSSSSGTYTLSGAGSSLSTGLFVVGYHGTGTFTQTGGSVTASIGVEVGFGNSGTYRLSGGTLSTGEIDVGGTGAGVFTQNGGSVTTNGGNVNLGFGLGTQGGGTYNLTGGSLSAGAISVGAVNTGTFNQTGGTVTTNAQPLYVFAYYPGTVATYALGGGTLTVGSVGAYPEPNYGTGVFHFNGGTLQAGASDAPNAASNPTTFFSGLTLADVQAGGARIDTQGYNVTVAQSLASGTATGTLDGGLTKLGTGTLTLTGANTYTGPTTVSAGTLQAGVGTAAGISSAFGLNSAVTLANVSGVTLYLNGFDTQIGSLTGGGTTGGKVILGSNALIVGADNTSPAAFAGGISGTGGLRKVGTGTQTLSGNNTYTGPTSLTAGTLLVNGTNSGAGTFTVISSGSVLGGTGTITGAVTVTSGGAFNPGNNVGLGGASSVVGTLSVGALTLNNSTSAIFDVNSATLYDELTSSGTVKLGGATLTINVNPNATFVSGQVLDLFRTTGTLSGSFAGISNGNVYSFGGDAFQAKYTSTDFELVAVPEPATWLAGALTISLGTIAWKRRKRA